MLPVLSFRFTNLHMKCPHIFYAIIDKLCWSARYSIFLLKNFAFEVCLDLHFFGCTETGWYMSFFLQAVVTIWLFMNGEKYSLNYQCNMVALFCLHVYVSLCCCHHCILPLKLLLVDSMYINTTLQTKLSNLHCSWRLLWCIYWLLPLRPGFSIFTTTIEVKSGCEVYIDFCYFTNAVEKISFDFIS
jgi:hypothetical protein